MKASSKRRHKFRSRRIFGLWPRVAFLVLLAIVSVAFLVGAAVKVCRPYRAARDAASSMRQTQINIDAARQENLRLTRRVAYLKTPDGIAAEARAFGYVRPGEMAFVITHSPPASSPAATPPPAAALPPPSTFSERARGFWRRVTGRR